MNKRSLFKPIFAALVCHVFWGFSFMAARVAMDSATVFVLLSHRFLLALAVMSALVLCGKAKLQLRGKRVALLLALGLAQPVVYFLGEQYGILHSSTIFSGVMIAMIPLLSTLAAIPVLGERPTAGQLFFSLLSVGGVIGIGLQSRSSGTIDLLGVVCLVIAVCSAAVYTLINRGICEEFTPFERSYMMILLGAACFTALALIQNRGDLGACLRPLGQTPYLLAILFLAVCCSVICFFCNAYYISYMSVARGTVFSNLTTAVSIFAGAVFLHEPFSWLGLLFCLMILLGIYGVQRTSDPLAGER